MKEKSSKVSSKSKSSSSDNNNKDVVVPTSCTDWSLNDDKSSKKRFWWNSTYSISIWDHHLPGLTGNGASLQQLNDTDVWRAYLRYQVAAVYRQCAICGAPEGNEDLWLCTYCGGTVHRECSDEATEEMNMWKPANKGFELQLRCCHACNDVKDAPKRKHVKEEDGVRRAVRRALTIRGEYPPQLTQDLEQIEAKCTASSSTANDQLMLMASLRSSVASYFQPHQSSSILRKQPIASKAGGLGVVAHVKIPRFTIIGVYPGYEDPLSGEQVKVGRPAPKYSLVDLNCANYYNNVFTEYQNTFTPFINEPNVHETSNTAWIQEPHRPEGRLSVMTVRDIEQGEELLIGYGPMYPRDYPHAYDAYAFHEVEEFKDPPCFALWHWTSVEEKDSNFVCYVGFDKDTQTYSYWETEDEVKQKGETATDSGNVADGK